MNLQEIREERQKWMTWKNIAPLREAIEKLPNIDTKVELGDVVALACKDEVDADLIENTARMMMPWRKGPFNLFGLFIDTEWKSNIKYNLLRPHFNLKDK